MTKKNRFPFILVLLVPFFLFQLSCNRENKTESKKTSPLTLKWGALTDSLLRDTIKKDLIVDSLKKQVLNAPDDTTAINYLNELAQNWKNRPNLILAREAALQSNKLGFKYGEIDALSRIGHYYYWTDDYEKADSCLSLAYKRALERDFKRIQVQTLIVLGKSVRIQGDFPRALRYFQQALHKASEMGDKSQSAFCLNCIGEVFRLKNDNAEALYNFQQALSVAKQSGDKIRIASSLSSIGDVYRIVDDYSRALDYFQQAIAIARQSGDKNLTAFCLNNMGEVYRVQGDVTEGLKYLQEAMYLAKEIGDNVRISSCLSSIAYSYQKLGDIPKALDYFRRTTELAKETGDKGKVAFCLNGIGEIYVTQKENQKALVNFSQALKIAEEAGDKTIMAESMSSIGNVYLDLNDLVNAKQYAEKSLPMAKDCNTPMVISGAAELLYHVYEKTADYKKAYEMHCLYIEMKDSIVNKESIKKFASQEYKVKEEMLKTEQLNRDIAYKTEEMKKESEIRHQKLVRNGFIAGAVLLCGLVFFVYRNLKQSRKAHKIIAAQKKLVETQKAITEQQKQLVEEKQKEIVDSINYAKRIQQALFAHDEILGQNLPEYFVLFKPKDIISGDFYWATQKENRFYLAVCDSTGHGVPGAFMSLLNISFLNEAVTEKNIVSPNEIFNHARKRLIENISQDGKQDGMDGILLCFDNNALTYAAAHNTPVLISKGRVRELPADKMPIGKWEKEDSFMIHTIEAGKGDLLYLLTDGYADQFGGPEGKKFKSRQLLKLLEDTSHLTMEKQKEMLEKTFEEWKGSFDQVDDVTIIGIRF